MSSPRTDPGMPDGPSVLDLVTDARLSRDARLIGVVIHELGAGCHEVSTTQWQRMLGRSRQGLPKRQTIAAWTDELVAFGYTLKHPGGRGAPKYESLLQSPTGTVNALQSPTGTVEGNALQSSMGTVDASTVLLGDGRTSPSSYTEPPPPPMNARARAIVESEEGLKGCRGSLSDYLVARVGPADQHGYVRSVQGFIEGADEWVWSWAGEVVPTEDRAGIVAGCLNDLLQGDEVGRYFTKPPGDVANLRSKIRYRTKTILGAKRDAERDTGPGAPKGRGQAGGTSQPPRGRVHVEG